MYFPKLFSSHISFQVSLEKSHAHNMYFLKLSLDNGSRIYVKYASASLFLRALVFIMNTQCCSSAVIDASTCLKSIHDNKPSLLTPSFFFFKALLLRYNRRKSFCVTDHHAFECA